MLFQKVKFEEGERMLILVRRHWFRFLVRIMRVVITAKVPFLAAWVMTFTPFANIIETAWINYSSEILFFSTLWLLFNWMNLAYLWTDYYLDLWIITDRRVISVDQISLFFREVGSFRIERLQDIHITIPGFLATMLDYGHIEAQTAADEVFLAHNLPNPHALKRLLSEAADNRIQELMQNDKYHHQVLNEGL